MHIGFKDIDQPSLPEQVVNLVKEAPALIRSGFKHVPDEVFEQRLSLCRTCHYCEEDKENKKVKCTKCGCNMLNKARFLSVKCPVGTWGVHV